MRTWARVACIKYSKTLKTNGKRSTAYIWALCMSYGASNNGNTAFLTVIGNNFSGS